MPLYHWDSNKGKTASPAVGTSGNLGILVLFRVAIGQIIPACIFGTPMVAPSALTFMLPLLAKVSVYFGTPPVLTY